MANILMVRAATISGADSALRTRLQNQSHTVTDIAFTTDPDPHFSGKDLIIIMQEANIGSTAFVDAYTARPTPIISFRSHFWMPLGMTSIAPTASSRVAVNVSNTSHPMAAGYSGEVEFLTSAGFPETVGDAAFGAGVQKVINRSGSTTLWHAFAYPSGAAMATGNAPARRAGWHLLTNNNSTWTAATFALFDAVIAWGLDGGVTLDPANIQASVSGGTVTLTWNATSLVGVTQYHIHRRTPQTGAVFTPSNSATRIGTVTAGTHSFQDSPGNGNYDYQVFAWNGNPV